MPLSCLWHKVCHKFKIEKKMFAIIKRNHHDSWITWHGHCFCCCFRHTILCWLLVIGISVLPVVLITPQETHAGGILWIFMSILYSTHAQCASVLLATSLIWKLTLNNTYCPNNSSILQDSVMKHMLFNIHIQSPNMLQSFK